MADKDGRGGKRAGAGRPKKPTIELSANKGMASRVLSSLPEEQYWRDLLRAELAPEARLTLDLGEKRLIKETLQYLTDRRDGKPAQGVFVGDTRETARPLDFGDLPMPTSHQSGTAGKPN